MHADHLRNAHATIGGYDGNIMGQKPNPIPVAHMNSKAFMFRVVKTAIWSGVDADWLYNFEFKRPDETYWHTGESWFEENRHDIAKNIKDWMTGWGITT